MFDCIEEKKLRVMEFLYLTGALKINFEEPYLLSSGVRSPLYIDASALISDVSARTRCSGPLLFFINESHPVTDAVAGIANGGTVWASPIANSKLVPLLYVLTSPKDHGLYNQIAGEIPFDGAKVIVLDDVITTGKSALSAVNALRAGKNGKKAEVLGVYSVFDWDIPSVNKLFEENNIEKHSLVTVRELLEFGVQKQLLDKEVAQKLFAFYIGLD